MGSQPFLNFSRKPVLIGMMMFGFLMLLTQYLSYERYLLLRASEMRELNNEANSVKERLQTVLGYNLSIAQTLGFIVENYGVPHDFDSVGAALLKSNQFVDAVQLVEGGVITHVFPMEGNEVVIGYNILKDSARNSGAYTAIETRKFFWAGPIELKQGGVGIIGRQPLFKNDKFQGFSAVIIKLPTFLRAIGIDTSGSNDFKYQLSRISSDQKNEVLFLPNHQSFRNAYKATIKVPDGEWKLSVARKSNTQLIFAITFSFLGLLLSITGGLFAWYIAKQPQQLNKLVEEKTTQLAASENNYRTTVARVSDAFIALDKNWRYTFLNDAALSTHPLGREGTIGKVLWEVHPELLGTVFWDKYHEAMETGKVVEVESYYAPMDTWFSVKVYPSDDGLTIFYNDVSESKKAEQEIIIEKNLSESIINSLPGIFYLADLNGKLMRWNKNFETVSGYTAKEINHMRVREFVGMNEQEVILQKKQLAIEKGMSDLEARFLGSVSV